MHAVLTRLKVISGHLEEAQELAGSLIMPAYVENGARGAFVLAACDRTELVVLVLYRTRSEAEMIDASEQVKAIRCHWDSCLLEPPVTRHFDALLGTTSTAPAQELSGDVVAMLTELTRAL